MKLAVTTNLGGLRKRLETRLLQRVKGKRETRDEENFGNEGWGEHLPATSQFRGATFAQASDQ